MERPKTTIPFSFSDTFTFRQRSGELNWKEIQNLDIDSLIQSGNISNIKISAIFITEDKKSMFYTNLLHIKKCKNPYLNILRK